MNLRFAKKTVFHIFLVMLSAVGLVATLAWKALKPVNEKSNFNRIFITDKLHESNVGVRPKDVLDFAGNTDYSIYFTTKSPAQLYVTDNNLQNGHYINLNTPNNSKIASRFSCIVDSPAVYILAGSLPGIFKTTLEGSSLNKYQFPGGIFTRTALISENSFALRMFDQLDQILAKGNLTTSELKKERNISEKNEDAGISTDGRLLYDNETKSLLYIHFYRNEILCLDTNLNLIRKLNTIDINSSSLKKAEEVKSEGIITNLSPKRLLNAYSITSNGSLYNLSKVKGDNETVTALRDNSVIDVYDIKTGSCKGSFYIPMHKKEKLNSFRIVNNQIISMYRGYLVAYALPQIK